MCSNFGRFTLLLCIHIALRLSAGISLSPFYRHIAPLERRKSTYHYSTDIALRPDKSPMNRDRRDSKQLGLRWSIELMNRIHYNRFHALRFTHFYPRNLRNPLNP